MRNYFIGLMVALFIGCSFTVKAQTNMAGRTYHNANIFGDMIQEAAKDINKEIPKLKKEALAEFEKKEGRKMTAEEEAKLDAEVKKQLATIDVAKKGTKIAITVEFKDAKNLVLSQNTKVSDEVLKAAGYGWLKRKAMKAALALAPKSQKGTYVVKGDMVIMSDNSNEKDTMYVSADGKFLFGKFDKKTKFKLTRTK